MATGLYAFLILEKEIELTRKANQSTEARLRVLMDQYDLIFASIDSPDVMERFIGEHQNELESLRSEYEYVIEVDNEHLNLDEEIDIKRNDLESRIGSLHRKILLFARVQNILTQENVKEYFGKFRGSMNPAAGVSGGDTDRRFL